EQALRSLWGPVLAISTPTHIYIEGMVRNGGRTAGAGIYLGDLSYSNKSLQVPGPGKLTADRARLYAIYKALQIEHLDTTVIIYCTSKLVIRQLCYHAARNSAIGWPAENVDVYKAIVQMLSRRHAETFFVFLNSRPGNPSHQHALALAKQG
ncbi:hypothetical protein C8F01DRAFT_925296, partial [Mycena amicta]